MRTVNKIVVLSMLNTKKFKTPKIKNDKTMDNVKDLTYIHFRI